MHLNALRLLALAGCLASAAAAQAPTNDQNPADVLKGPSVTDRDIPGGASAFGAEQRGGGLERARAQYEALLKSVNALSAKEAPPSLRLGDEQRRKIEAIAREFQARTEEFRRANAADLKRVRDLRDRQNAPTTKRDAPAAPPSAAPASQAERDELLRLLQRLEQARPDPAPTQARVWDALTEGQREHVRAEMKKTEDQTAQQRAEKRLDELRRNKKPAPSASAPGQGAPPAVADKPLPTSDTAERRARLKAKIADALSVPPDKADMIAGLLFGPPRESEKGMTFADRLRARIAGLPKELVTDEQRSRLGDLAADLPGARE